VSECSGGLTDLIVGRAARRVEGLGEVAQYVFGMFEADRKAHVARGGAGGELLLAAELAVRRRGRMNSERARVADIGDVIEQLQRGLCANRAQTTWLLGRGDSQSAKARLVVISKEVFS
jgi:hypothetical protein